MSRPAGAYIPAVLDISALTGDLDLNIVIRTFLIKSRKAYFQLGGAVVYDSDPEAEYQETLDKGRALFKALSEGS